MKKALKSLAGMIQQADPEATLTFEFWDGEKLTLGNQPTVTLRFKTEESAQDLIQKKWLGFGERYTSGDIEVDGDLRELLRLGIAVSYDGIPATPRQKLELLRHYVKSRNTRQQATKNITHHYDKGDRLYSLYLDETMAYSCAYFKNGCDSLAQAQRNKYEHTCRKLLLKPGEKLIDVGCGWGGMLIHAAQNYGVKGVGCTISRNQYEFANNRIRELGLRDNIEVVYEDYRNVTGKFDKFVSIGMFEHVGKAFIPTFVKKVGQMLTRGGLGLLHTIGKDTDSAGDPWVMKYIFPGAYIPSLSLVIEHLGAQGFSILDVENLRLHYARTLELWAENFDKNVEKVREMFDEYFVRMWRLYLNACSVGFRYGETRLYQILFSNGINNNLPLTREHCYGPTCR